jgi:hypothetical protein
MTKIISPETFIDRLIKPPKVKFFHPSNEDQKQGLMGFYRLGVIYLNCRLPQNEILNTARHETRHAYQDHRHQLWKLSRAALERDAFIYERESE